MTFDVGSVFAVVPSNVHSGRNRLNDDEKKENIPQDWGDKFHDGVVYRGGWTIPSEKLFTREKASGLSWHFFQAG